MHHLPVLMAVFIIAIAAPPRAGAEQSDRPTVTITGFEGNLKTPGPDGGGTLADVLASRVEESGCCRVMLRTWLPQATAAHGLPLTTIREAAVAARVEYVVTGRVAKTRTIPRPPAPSIGSVLGQLGPARPGSVRGPMAPRMPHMVMPRPVTMVTLEMRIVDAAGGQVLRTVNITRPEAKDDIALVTGSPEISDALIRAISNLARERR